METIFTLVPKIGSAFSLAAFAFAIYAFMQNRKLKKSSELIELAKEEERPDLINKAIQDYKIEVPEGEALTSEQRYDLAKRRMRHKGTVQKYKMITTVVLGLALLAVVAYQVKHNIEKDSAESEIHAEATNSTTTADGTTSEIESNSVDTIDSTVSPLVLASNEAIIKQIAPKQVEKKAIKKKQEKQEITSTNLIYENLDGCKYINESNSILKTSGGSKWNAQCNSKNKLPKSQSGGLSLEIQNPNQHYMFGLSHKTIKPTYQKMKFGLGVQQKGHNGAVQINYFENGENKGSFDAMKGDKISIEKSLNGKLSYHKNGKLVKESLLKVSTDLHAFVALKTTGSEISNLEIDGGWVK